ncbi:MAG: hypothetical protein ACREP2_05615 [Rhodanobacteraceae bacterium]
MKPRIALLTSLLAASLLAACGGGGISGTYTDTNGLVSITFNHGNATFTDPDGKASTWPYTMHGKEITVTDPSSGAHHVLRLDAKGCLRFTDSVYRMCKS